MSELLDMNVGAVNSQTRQTQAGQALAVKQALPTLVFIHGWAFDTEFWRPLRDALGAWPQHDIDLGYFQDGGMAQLPAGPLVMIGHSFGYLHALSMAPAQAQAWISINGFSRFSAAPDFDQGVAPRVLQKMMTRLQSSPDAVIREFRRRCGAGEPVGALNAEALRQDLERMLNEDQRARQAAQRNATLVLAGEADQVVPAAMTRAAFAGCDIVWKAGAGHLLPQEDVAWCAAHIDDFVRARFCLGEGGRTGRAQDSAAPAAEPAVLPGAVTQKSRIRDRFAAAAASYEQEAIVQRTAAQQLMQRIAALDFPARPRVLEIGCGTGLLTRKLAGFFDDAVWTITDIAEPMLAAARQSVRLPGECHYQVMDGEYPDPACSGSDGKPPSFDLICSSMAMQWFDDLDAGLARLSALLAPGAYLAIATLAEGTFAEWRAAHHELGLTPASLVFPPAERIGAQLFRCGLQGGVQTECVVQDCGSAQAFLRGLKAIGARTGGSGRRALTGPQLRRVCQAFDQSGAKASYQMAFGIWRKLPS